MFCCEQVIFWGWRALMAWIQYWMASHFPRRPCTRDIAILNKFHLEFELDCIWWLGDPLGVQSSHFDPFFGGFTLWLFIYIYITWYRWPIEIDGFPMKHGGSFHGELLNNQMVVSEAFATTSKPNSDQSPCFEGPKILQSVLWSMNKGSKDRHLIHLIVKSR